MEDMHGLLNNKNNEKINWICVTYSGLPNGFSNDGEIILIILSIADKNFST